MKERYEIIVRFRSFRGGACNSIRFIAKYLPSYAKMIQIARDMTQRWDDKGYSFLIQETVRDCYSDVMEAAISRRTTGKNFVTQSFTKIDNGHGHGDQTFEGELLVQSIPYFG